MAHRISMTTQRLQSLAVKAELADVLAAEILVRDERSLREYLLKLARVAKRHNVLESIAIIVAWAEISLKDDASGDGKGAR
jgi:hypothetical protein